MGPMRRSLAIPALKQMDIDRDAIFTPLHFKLEELQHNKILFC